jgi:hypothetical protein
MVNRDTYMKVIKLLILVALLSSSAEAAQRLYKWVDQDGVVHYAEQPPENQSWEPFDIYKDRIPEPPPAPPEPVVTNTYGPGIDPPEKPPEGPTPDELEIQKRQLCERGRYLLNVLVPRPRAVLVGPDGSPRAVTDTERQDYLEEGNRLVGRYCPAQ